MRIVIPLTIVVFTFGVLGASQLSAPFASGKPQTEIIRQSRQLSVFAGGIVEGRSRERQLKFVASGRLISIGVREGEVVRAGDALARLDSTVWERELAVAQANLAIAVAEWNVLKNGSRQEARRTARARVSAARVQLDHARRSHERAASLPGNAISQQALDDKLHAIDASEAALAIAVRAEQEVIAGTRSDVLSVAAARVELEQANVARAEAMLARTILRAPADGTVLRVSAELGDLVGPERPQPAVTLIDASEIRVRTFVEELDAPRVRPGMLAFVSADGITGSEIHGKVISVAPGMTKKVRLRDDPHERLDSKVREVLVSITDPPADLVIGLQVDVALAANSNRD